MTASLPAPLPPADKLGDVLRLLELASERGRIAGMFSDNATRAATVRAYQAHANGFEFQVRHWTGRFRFSSGVLLVAEVCGAHWLVDAIASLQTRLERRDPSARDFQVWRLELPARDGDAWRLLGGSDSDKWSVGQRIEFTTFPAELAPFTLWLEHGALLLPEER